MRCGTGDPLFKLSALAAEGWSRRSLRPMLSCKLKCLWTLTFSAATMTTKQLEHEVVVLDQPGSTDGHRLPETH